MCSVGYFSSVLAKTEMDQQCFVKLSSIKFNEIRFSSSRIIQAYISTDEDLLWLGNTTADHSLHSKP
jgi:hypothetical protein